MLLSFWGQLYVRLYTIKDHIHPCTMKMTSQCLRTGNSIEAVSRASDLVTHNKAIIRTIRQLCAHSTTNFLLWRPLNQSWLLVFQKRGNSLPAFNINNPSDEAPFNLRDTWSGRKWWHLSNKAMKRLHAVL